VSIKTHPAQVLLFFVAGAIGFVVIYFITPQSWQEGRMALAIPCGIAIGLLFAFALRVADQWEKVPVLRLGHFRGMYGPGAFWVVPFIDSTPYRIDLRIVTYEVPHQKSLTRENVPVVVDSVVYFKVEDAQAAVLQVQDYKVATELAAQTILRDVIGKVHLDELLAEREKIAEQVRENLMKLTGQWGVTVPNLEVREVVIPQALEDAIAREPAAEREKRARVKLAEAERLTAAVIYEAAQTYARDPVALQLRSMNMLYEMCMEGRSVVIFVPTETHLGMPTPMGVYGLLDRGPLPEVPMPGKREATEMPPAPGPSGGE
jgi:regulator of protease activity HflC (stomatin/prohibitin superfamily)